MRSELEAVSHKSLRRVYESPEIHVSRKKAKAVPLPAPPTSEAIIHPSAPPHCKSDSTRESRTMNSSDAKLEQDENHAGTFSKSGSQLGPLGPWKDLGRTLAGEELPDIVENPHCGHRVGSVAWHKGESIEAFLSRHVATDPTTQTGADGWLWVDSPTIPRLHAKRQAEYDPDALTSCAGPLLEGFVKQFQPIIRQYGDKGDATVNRRMAQYRDQLERDLLTAAVATGVTSGKWMFFPGPSDLARYWRLVATATSEGRLGPAAKSAVLDLNRSDTLICVYTYDFSDTDDVRRVLQELVDMGLVSEGRKPIYYKCDAYTHLCIDAKNEYKLRASLYSSRDILFNDSKDWAGSSGRNL